jgi:hypothetical protein
LLQVTSSPAIQIITGGDPEKHAYSLNLHRRHLKPEKKRELIARLLREKPEASDRQIAAAAQASPTTVGIVRAKLGSTVQPGQLAKRVGKDGKARKLPAKKKTAGVDSKARKQLAKPKRSASQNQRELEAKQAHIDELEAARQHDQDLAEQLQAAKIKILGLENEVDELKAENAKLREELAAQKVAA